MSLSPDNSLSCWICPHCREPLSKSSDALRCVNNHAYDRASQGYVNLLLANQKNSRAPGDSGEMLSARRDVFAVGIYDALFDAVVNKIADLRQTLGQTWRLLDIGCGEGSYLNRIATELTPVDADNVELCGIDISKAAAKKAASLVSQANIAVASNYAIPLAQDSVDLVLNVFAPVSVEEVQRVLQDGGFLIRVSPGVKHLQQIKAAIYRTAKPHEQANPLQGFKSLEKQRIEFVKSLEAEQLRRILAMTPLNWRGDEEAKKALIDGGEIALDFDFALEVFQPINER